MKYSELPAPPRHNGGELFLHCVEIMLKPERKEELEYFLLESFGAKHTNWRVRFHGNRLYWQLKGSTSMPAKVRFATQNDAMRFKLCWQPCEDVPPLLSGWVDLETLTSASLRFGELMVFGASTGTGKSMIK